MPEQETTNQAALNWQPINTPIQNNGSSNGKAPPDKPQKPRKLVGIPTVTALSSQSSVFYQAFVTKDPQPWDAIENSEGATKSAKT